MRSRGKIGKVITKGEKEVEDEKTFFVLLIMVGFCSVVSGTDWRSLRGDRG